MTHSTYALSHTERTCLVYSMVSLVSATFYGFLAGRVVRSMSQVDLVMVLHDFPVLLLISICAGFLFTSTAHYAIRQALTHDRRGVEAHD